MPSNFIGGETETQKVNYLLTVIEQVSGDNKLSCLRQGEKIGKKKEFKIRQVNPGHFSHYTQSGVGV